MPDKTQDELIAAVRALVAEFTSGRSCKTQNPYTRECVRKGLVALQNATQFNGHWMDANRDFESERLETKIQKAHARTLGKDSE